MIIRIRCIYKYKSILISYTLVLHPRYNVIDQNILTILLKARNL
jgi:hypothetical protein